MVDEWLVELGKGIGRWFLQPLFYWGIVLMFLTSYKRIKRERADFGKRIFNQLTEWKKSIIASLLIGLIISVVMLVAGVVLPVPTIMLLAAVTIVFSITGRISWLSPAYVLGITFLLVVVAPSLSLSFVPEQWLVAWENTSLAGIAILLGVLLVVEAFLLSRQQKSFPQLTKGKRGKYIGQHLLKQLSILPVFVLLPGGAIEAFAPWWPVFSVAGESYGIVLLPIILGFEHVFKSMHPLVAAKELGKSSMLVAIIVLAIAVGSVFVPVLAIVAVAVAIVGRELVQFLMKRKDQVGQAYFADQGNGLPILGVIPGTPADKMGLLVGEVIEKVNQIPVTTEQEFYEAVQSNRAYCKIALRNLEGELRFTQTAMYEGDHYELGLVFVRAKDFALELKEEA